MFPGLQGLPTYNRGLPDKQYLFVNGRPVRDKLIVGAVRGAYADFLSKDRHPAVALFLDLPAREVDVNVHPAKTEVRFRDAGMIRGLLVGALRHALAEAGHRASTTTSAYALGRMTTQGGAPPALSVCLTQQSVSRFSGAARPGLVTGRAALKELSAPSVRDDAPVNREDQQTDHPLGAARAQLHETYIVAQTGDGLVIVDQHAAHERLVYERMKARLAEGRVPAQGLLIPEIVELTGDEIARLEERFDEFAELGLVIERFGEDAVMVRETPALLGEVNVKALVQSLADDLAAIGETLSLKGKTRRRLLIHGVSWLRARRATFQWRGNERAPAPDGGDAPFRPVQSRPAHLRRIETCRH